MPPSFDRPTRLTRDAANVAAAAVVVYALLWVLSTQVRSVRAISPFADDPWDVFASYAYPGGLALRKLVETPLPPIR